jgi:hypothetical protein
VLRKAPFHGKMRQIRVNQYTHAVKV